MPVVFVYTTFPSKDSAESISTQLLKGKYIACYNIFTITSGYWWQGTTQNENEFVSVMKTVEEKIPNLELKYLELHPYDIPCFVYWSIKASKSYEAWIRQSLQ